MKSVNMRSTKPDRYAQAPQQQPHELSAPQPHAWPLSPCEDPHALIAMRAYARYGARGDRDGSAFDDWLDAEREILGQIQPT